MPIFYAPDITTIPLLPEEESAHAIRVLRLKAGDEINIVDGVGGFYKAKIITPDPRHCEVEFTAFLPDPQKRDYKLHIAIAPTKNIDRLEWFIEKATEIGVDEITPVITQFSERKIIKPERLEKIIISASKQSKKALFPVLNPLCSFDDFLKQYNADRKFIAHCYEGRKEFLKDACIKSTDTIILIGPEGDFSEEEVEKSLLKEYIPVSLGNSRLRTETAGVVACAAVQFVNQ